MTARPFWLIALLLGLVLAGALALFPQSPGYWSVGVWTGTSAPAGAFSLGQTWIDTSTIPAVVRTLTALSPATWTNNLRTVQLSSADFVTANNTTLQTITGLSWTLPANSAQSASFSCALAYAQQTAATVVGFGVQSATIAPTNIFATGRMSTSATAITTGVLATLSTTTATDIVTATPSATGTVWAVNLTGTIENPSNPSANTINVMVRTANGADVVRVKRGSACQIF